MIISEIKIKPAFYPNIFLMRLAENQFRDNFFFTFLEISMNNFQKKQQN